MHTESGWYIAWPDVAQCIHEKKQVKKVRRSHKKYFAHIRSHTRSKSGHMPYASLARTHIACSFPAHQKHTPTYIIKGRTRTCVKYTAQMQYELVGRIKQIFPEQSFGANGFKKREFIVTTEEMYPQDIKLELLKDK